MSYNNNQPPREVEKILNQIRKMKGSIFLESNITQDI